MHALKFSADLLGIYSMVMIFGMNKCILSPCRLLQKEIQNKLVFMGKKWGVITHMIDFEEQCNSLLRSGGQHERIVWVLKGERFSREL